MYKVSIYMPHLTPSDLTICYNNNDGTASAGGYKLSSILLQEGMSPMTTMSGGASTHKGNNNQVSAILRDLAVPAGLLCLPGSKCTSLPHGENKGIVDKGLYDRLLELASMEEGRAGKKTRARKPSTTKGTRRRN